MGNKIWLKKLCLCELLCTVEKYLAFYSDSSMSMKYSVDNSKYINLNNFVTPMPLEFRDCDLITSCFCMDQFTWVLSALIRLLCMQYLTTKFQSVLLWGGGIVL